MSAGDEVPRLPTGISGFDSIALGGIPMGRCTLVSGTTGTGKTLYGIEFLARGVAKFDQRAVFVTLEESAADIRTYAASLGHPIEEWEAAGRWRTVDASPDPSDDAATVGAYSFDALVTRIETAVRETEATRVCVDSIGAVFARYPAARSVRHELFRITSAMERLGVTTLITTERLHEHDGVTRLGAEEFVVDNVIVLRNLLHNERRRRTIEILKFRGAPHRTGEWLFTIAPREGIAILPLALLVPRLEASADRVTSGNAELDRMCDGGFFKDAIVLITGPSGVGKTLTSLKFAHAGTQTGERCLLYTFDETRDRLARNAAGWGMSLDGMEATGLLQVEAEYPEGASLEDHFLKLQAAITDYAPSRLVIDSLTTLERVSSTRGLLEFVLAVSAVVRQHEITTLFTAAPGSRVAPPAVPPIAREIASLADVSILLRYIEVPGEIQRVITVLQARGSDHDHSIRTYTINNTGMHIGDPPTSLAYILSGLSGAQEPF